MTSNAEEGEKGKPLGQKILEAAALITEGMEHLVQIDEDNRRVLAEYASFQESQNKLNQFRTNQINKLKWSKRRQAVLLALIVVLYFWNQRRFDDQASAAKKNCLAANVSRSLDKQSWDLEFQKWDGPISRSTPNPNATPEQKQELADFIQAENNQKVFISQKDQLRDCSKASSRDPVQVNQTTTTGKPGE